MARRFTADGRSVRILYEKANGVRASIDPYEHPYAIGQVVGRDERGHLRFMTGRSVVTTRGIEDLPPGLHSADRIAPLPTSFVALGRLIEIEYKSVTSSGVKTQVASYGNPLLAHDERGNLHALYGAALTDHGGRAAQAKRNPTMARRKRSRRARRNPILNPSDWAARAQRTLIAGGIVGGTAIATNALLDVAFTRFAPATMTPMTRSLVKIGVGVLGGTALSMYAKKGTQEAMVTGFMLGGVIGGGTELYNANVRPRVDAILLPRPAGQVSYLPGAQPAAGFAYGAQAMAASYR